MSSFYAIFLKSRNEKVFRVIGYNIYLSLSQRTPQPIFNSANTSCITQSADKRNEHLSRDISLRYTKKLVQVVLDKLFLFPYQYPYFFLFTIRNNTVIITAIISAATIENHIPSIPQNKGNIKTAAIWNKSERRNDMSADVRPSLSAVKNDEPNIAKPANMNVNEYIKNPRKVKFISSVSYPTNTYESGYAHSSEITNIATANTDIITMLFLSNPLSSARFPAPK